MRHRIFLHLVWTTHDRRPVIDARAAAFLRGSLPIITRQERGRVLEIGVVKTHVHMLVRVHPLTSIPRLMQRLKGGTSAGVFLKDPARAVPVRWAKGYNVESVSERALDAARRYVREQHVRHPQHTIADDESPSAPDRRVSALSRERA